jgi:prepilin-type N-terminal cleavage/methylation domain-containing protein
MRGGGDVRLIRRARSRGHDCDGFTLVEVLVTMLIVLLVMTSVIAVMVRMRATLSMARQRQQATALASASLEQLRALPLATLAAGLAPSDLAGDANIVSAAGVTRFVLPGSGIDEPLVAQGDAQTPAPLRPHLVSRPVDGVTYVVGTYVSQLTTTSPYLLTSVVQWSSNASATGRTLVQRSTAFSPTGCLSTATHPFAGPCQPLFSGEAGQAAASIAVVNDVDPAQPISGFDGRSMELDLPALSTSLALEQTGTATSRATTTGAAADVGSSHTTSGGQSAAVTTSTDPSGAATPTGSAATPAQTSSTMSLTGSAGTLSATPSSTDAGSASAAAAQSVTCPDASGAPLAPAQACASGTARSSGADAVLTTNLSGTSTVRALGSFDIARLAPAPADARAVAARVTSNGGPACPTTAGDGCAYAATSRSLGTVMLGGLPPAQASDDRPASFTSAVAVTGLTETARAEAGAGERAPSYARAGGTLSYWNGTATTSLSLAGVTTPSTIDPPATTATYRGTGGDVTITVDPLIVIGSATSDTSGSMPCASEQCSRNVTGSTISISLTYLVVTAGTVTTRFAVTANLGSVLAKATYRSAPNA